MSPVAVPIEILFWVAVGLFGLSLVAIAYTLIYRLVENRREARAAPRIEQARKQMLMAIALGPQELEPITLPSERRVAEGIVLRASRILNTVTGEGRANLVQFLGRSGFPQWAEQRLTSRRSISRAIACEILGSMRVTGSAPQVRRHITDHDADVRQAAVRATGRLRDVSAVPALLASLHQTRGNSPIVVATALLAIGPSGEQPLSNALSDSDHTTRRVAAQVIGLLNLFDARDDLVRALKAEPDPWTKTQLITALGRVGGPDVRGPLRFCLSQEPMVRAAAVRALVSLDDSATLGYLQKELWDPSPGVCRAAAESLASSGPAGRSVLEGLPAGSSAAAYAEEALARVAPAGSSEDGWGVDP